MVLVEIHVHFARDVRAIVALHDVAIIVVCGNRYLLRAEQGFGYEWVILAVSVLFGKPYAIVPEQGEPEQLER